MVDIFQAEPNRFDVMILSPKAGGVGLTLTTANHVVHLSRWWNPAVEDQATDRVYRIGQTKEVFVHIPLAVHPDPALSQSSFDLRLDNLMERKRALTRDLFLPPEASDADLVGLFDDVSLSRPIADSDAADQPAATPESSEAPTLEIAAAQLGVGRETARDAIRAAAGKLGVRRTSDIVRRMLELMCAVHEPVRPDPQAIAPALGLTISEARVALEIAGGRSQAEAAEGLGLKTETVRGYVKNALAKTGLARGKDLGRLVVETQALSQLVSLAEPVFTVFRLAKMTPISGISASKNDPLSLRL